MGRVFLVTLEGMRYSCKYCMTHLALPEDVVSKAFHCKYGTAYLLSRVVNVSVGKIEDRMMISGLHSVAEIFCVCCGSILGWKYVVAYDKYEKYKEGKFILERFKITDLSGIAHWINPEADGVHPAAYANSLD